MDEALSSRLRARIAQETARPVSAEARALSDAIRARHGASVMATLFYGSCLRPPTGAEIGSGGSDQRLYDFYALVENVRAATGNWLSALAGRILPPNIYYIEAQTPGGTARAKYAVLTARQFASGCRPATFQNYFWGRFAQPTAIVHAADPAIREQVCQALVDAIDALLGKTAPLLPGDAPASRLWTRAFAESYRCELRPESLDRAGQIYLANAERYDAIAADMAALYAQSPGKRGSFSARLAWPARRVVGKTLNVLRLFKAAFTFAGGVDYIVWKIERHSGVRPELTPWQRRHPILASPLLALRYWRKGAFR